MDLTTLSSTMANQAAATGIAQGTLHVQNATDNDSSKDSSQTAAKTGDKDSISLSQAGRALVAGSSSSSTQEVDPSLTARVTKLQKQLQQEQNSASDDPDKKRSSIATLRAQIQMLQSQLPKGSTTGGTAV